MSRARTQQGACALSLLLLAGCASEPMRADEAKTTDAKAEPGGNPYRERPKARATAPLTSRARVRFTAPKRWPSPRKAELPRRPRLGLVRLEEGLLRPDPRSLLALEEALGRDADLAALVSFVPTGKRVSLRELAKQAHQRGQSLLLIDRIHPSMKAAQPRRREGLLFRTRDARLLAILSRAPPALPTRGPRGLLDRLRVAYARVLKSP